jgi:hypothetical protein
MGFARIASPPQNIKACGMPFEAWERANGGVALWESVIQRFRKRSLDPDGSTKSKNKAGRSGKSSSIGCNGAPSASLKNEISELYCRCRCEETFLELQSGNITYCTISPTS